MPIVGGEIQPREWLIVGAVLKPHGVHGDLLVEIITDFPERLAAGVRFGLGPATGPQQYFEVFRIRVHKNQWLLSVKGVRDRDSILQWRGQYLFLPELTREELPEGYYYEHQLQGLRCHTADGTSLGSVVGLDTSGGQTRLIIRNQDRDVLVPWVPQIVTAVDPEGGTITLDPPRGLFDDDAVTAEPNSDSVSR